MSWELIYRTADDEQVTRHDTRDEALAVLFDHFIDAGITIADDPTAQQRTATTGGFSAQFDGPDGTRIAYAIRHIRTVHYLNLAQFEERLGMARGSLSKFRLPDPDVVVGPVNDDGSIPRGTARGWTPETIDEWNAARPGQGRRTDLADR